MRAITEAVAGLRGRDDRRHPGRARRGLGARAARTRPSPSCTSSPRGATTRAPTRVAGQRYVATSCEAACRTSWSDTACDATRRRHRLLAAAASGDRPAATACAQSLLPSTAARRPRTMTAHDDATRESERPTDRSPRASMTAGAHRAGRNRRAARPARRCSWPLLAVRAGARGGLRRSCVVLGAPWPRRLGRGPSRRHRGRRRRRRAETGRRAAARCRRELGRGSPSCR